jgi:hypothetical protein
MPKHALYLTTVTEVLALWSVEDRPKTLTAGTFEPRGQALIIRVDGEECYVHACETFHAPKDWTLLNDSVNDLASWQTFHAKTPEHARKLLKARVYRRKDGGNLREELEPTVSKRVPASGRTSAKPPDEKKALAALEKAKARAGEEGDVEYLTTTMEAVLDGDLVEADVVPPHKWMG